MGRNIFERLNEEGITGVDLRNTVYKYRSIRSAVKIIRTNQVYFSPVHKLEDVLELNPDNIDLSFTKEVKEKYWARLGVYDVTDAEHKGMMADSINNHYRKGAIGIFSAGRTPVNLHLWKHYGARETGVCFGFRSKHLDKVGWYIPNSAGTFIAFNVKYTDEPRVIKYLDPDENDLNTDILCCWFNTKTKLYEPEDEIRILNDVGSGPEYFEKELLYEVIFGRLTSQDSMDFILKLLAQHGYKVQRIGKARVQDGNMVIDYIVRL